MSVERTIDGDTLVVDVHGTEEHVRLLNIDTPETKDPNKPVECLGSEASAFTHHLVPDGTKVTLVYDAVKRDRYGRLLAAVYLEDGRSVSEELARAGLGIPIAVGANRSHLAAVKSAQSEAMENAFGFYDPAQKLHSPESVPNGTGRSIQCDSYNAGHIGGRDKKGPGPWSSSGRCPSVCCSPQSSREGDRLDSHSAKKAARNGPAVKHRDSASKC